MSQARTLTLGTRRPRQAKLRAPFARLHALTLQPSTTLPQLLAAMKDAEDYPDRHRLAEGAVYAAAARRFHHMTGRPYSREEQPA